MTVVMREFGAEIEQASNSPQDAVRWEVALAQHRAYQGLLSQLGAEVVTLPPLFDQPNGVFVQDTAVILPELVIWTRLGKGSRRGEMSAMRAGFQARELVGRRGEVEIKEPATLDGGDIVVVDKKVFIAETTRTNREGIEQVQRSLPGDYRLVEISTLQPTKCLHLRTGCSYLGKNTFLISPDWVDRTALEKEGYKILEVDSFEPMAANTRLIGETVIGSSAYPKTNVKLRAAGFDLREVDLSEITKAGGGASCVTLLI